MTTLPGRHRLGRTLFAAFLGLHALIHLTGAANGLGGAASPQLTHPISATVGVFWLIAAALLITSTGYVIFRPQRWWIFGAAGALISQMVIIMSWSDAAYGTIANAIILTGALYTYLTWGPRSFNAQYSRDVDQGRNEAIPSVLLTDADLADVPLVVQRYIRRSGAVGQPRVRNFSSLFHGQIRGGPSQPWMTFTGRQSNFYAPSSRFFLMDAARVGLPVQAFHRYTGSSATMKVKIASAATLVDARGPALDDAETVTLFNDLCVFAPGALADADIRWTETDAHTVQAVFTHGTHRVTAALAFDADGDLTDFTADGRAAMSADGKTLTPMRWSTPLSHYRRFGQHRLMGRGEGIWHAPEGNYTYLRFVVDSIDYNVTELPQETPRAPLSPAVELKLTLGSAVGGKA
ncbi:hypothetical protein IWX63_003078 [Arthrobacter sp. CAN_A2]|uniref:DUF6544 family protein n=1 Tax=Arthrobacter sp. CAN_A2 TaxID=2787718 RepID=UPI0018F01AFE